MKRLLLAVPACFALLLGSAAADEVALMTVQIGDEAPRPVAIELHEADAPKTVENFKRLARKGFYKGCAFHRAFPKILVQTGDPLSKKDDRSKVGIGGPGYTLMPEIRRRHPKGAVAMARLPDKINPSRVSNGSQFYICLQPMPTYDGQYTVFGQVLYGYEVLDAISTLPVDSNDYPVQRCTIRSVKIIPRGELPAAPAPVSPAKKSGKRWWQIFG